MSIPGIGFTAAAVILAEIGDFKDFDKREQLASWAGLAPTVYQSAYKLVTGNITKHGSRHIRRILVEVAQVIARTNRSKLKRFLLRIQAKKYYNVATVALARKVLCILHHLLMNREMYQDEGIKIKKTKSIDIDSSSVRAEMSLEDMIRSLLKAGYEVRNRKVARRRADTGG
jgi:transposase